LATIGAGISTAASIPDYRGPNGLWTLLEKGQKVKLPDFTTVTPTYSHMALVALVKAGIVTHVVSQNCDGLHLRSGLDRIKLSELHGNCFVEFCTDCSWEYVRFFDVTERSSFRKHVTGRYCENCSKIADSEESVPQLKDSIIHFGNHKKILWAGKTKFNALFFKLIGEKLRTGSPYNWEEATDAVKNTKLIVCIGTSLKVLKHYACLWPKKKDTDIIIVSIQWTPKDKFASLKINGYCDQVMKLLIENLKLKKFKKLNVEEYSLKTDPIFQIAVKLKKHELTTTSKPFLMDYVSTLKRSRSANQLIKIESKENVLNKTDGDPEDDEGEASTENVASWFTKSFKPRKKLKTNGSTVFTTASS